MIENKFCVIFYLYKSTEMSMVSFLLFILIGIVKCFAVSLYFTCMRDEFLTFFNITDHQVYVVVNLSVGIHPLSQHSTRVILTVVTSNPTVKFNKIREFSVTSINFEFSDNNMLTYQYLCYVWFDLFLFTHSFFFLSTYMLHIKYAICTCT